MPPHYPLHVACSTLPMHVVPVFVPFCRPLDVPTGIVLLDPSGHPTVTVPVSNTWPVIPLWVCSLLPGKDPPFCTTVLSGTNGCEFTNKGR